MKIKNINAISKNIDLIVKIIDIEPERKVISKRSGKKFRIADVKVADDSGMMILSAWDDMIDEISPGEFLKIKNAYVNEFRGKLSLNVGNKGSYTIIDESSPEAQFKVNKTLLHTSGSTGGSTSTQQKFIKIEEILRVSKGINTRFKVIRKDEPRGVNTKNGPQTVCEFLIGDETGCILMSLWNDDIYEIANNSYYEIKNSYTSTFRDILKLNKGRYGELKNISKEESGFTEVNESNNLSAMI